MRAFAFLCLLLLSAGSQCKGDWSSIDIHPPSEVWSQCNGPLVCDCCKMLQQVEELRQHFNTTLLRLYSEYERTLQQLEGTLANRTAFSVALRDARFECEGPHQEDTIIQYEHVFLNLGLDYDVSSGVFVAPLSGYYMFTITIHGQVGAAGSQMSACAKLYVNDAVMLSVSEENDNDRDDASTNVIIVELKAQDMVSVHLPPGCFLCDDEHHYNTFSGFLAYPSHPAVDG